jgi:hypothetical protein
VRVRERRHAGKMYTRHGVAAVVPEGAAPREVIGAAATSEGTVSKDAKAASW